MGSNPIPSATSSCANGRTRAMLPPMGQPKLRSYHISTVGCQMNKADSERLAAALDTLGLVESASQSNADVLVINSCVVRQSAEDRVTGMITSLKPLKQREPQKVLALMGCMVGPKTDGLRKQFPYVDVFMRPQHYQPLVDLLGERLDVDVDGCLADLAPTAPAVATYVPIIHGCNEFCTFCIVPYRRGRQVSRPVGDIVREVELLVARGVKEVTLLGQTVDAYGHDLPDRPDLADLLRNVHPIDGLERIRFLTSHPSYMTDAIIQAVAELPKVCESFNLPFQAGHDHVLEAMRRTYSIADYRRLVEGIRSAIPDASIVTDVIVGFPGETDAHFQATLDIIRDLRFGKVHAAAYSTRPGTFASRKLEDDLTMEVKQARLRAVEELQEGIATDINSRLLGSSVEVLVDDRHRGQWQGRSRSDKLIFFRDEGERLGNVVNIRIEKSSPWSLQGSVDAGVAAALER